LLVRKFGLSSKGQIIDGVTYTNQYQYNTANQVSVIVYPSGVISPSTGKRVRANYDDRGRFNGLDKVSDTGSLLAQYMSSVGYNKAGQITGFSLGNGVVENYGYSDDRLQLTSQQVTSGANKLMELFYNYEAGAGDFGPGTVAGNSGQLMKIGTNPAITTQNSTINGQVRNQTFKYDQVGRLASADASNWTGTTTWQRRYDYDRWGNRSGVWNAVSGGTKIQTVTPQTGSKSAPSRLLSYQ
jgi:hypothetical protein